MTQQNVYCLILKISDDVLLQEFIEIQKQQNISVCCFSRLQTSAKQTQNTDQEKLYLSHFSTIL